MVSVFFFKFYMCTLLIPFNSCVSTVFLSVTIFGWNPLKKKKTEKNVHQSFSFWLSKTIRNNFFKAYKTNFSLKFSEFFFCSPNEIKCIFGWAISFKFYFLFFIFFFWCKTLMFFSLLFFFSLHFTYLFINRNNINIIGFLL